MVEVFWRRQLEPPKKFIVCTRPLPWFLLEGVLSVRLFKGVAVVSLKKTKLWNINDKKIYKQMFFSVITENLNWNILIKNLVSFNRWNGVKDEKF